MSATTTEKTIYFVIPCGADKADQPTKARDLYTGPMFRHQLAAAEAEAAATEDAGLGPTKILILSALYGLVDLDTELEPYDLKMTQQGHVSPTRVTSQALGHGIDYDTAEVYAMLPKAYLAVLNEALATLDVYPQDIYEAAPGIGYQRGICTQFRVGA